MRNQSYYAETKRTHWSDGGRAASCLRDVALILVVFIVVSETCGMKITLYSSI